MCGFFLVYSTKKNKFKEYASKIELALKVIENRGPDYAGTLIERGIIFGHSRLSIQDTSSVANQPLESPSGRYIVLFNGEIYNHLKLRREYFPNDKFISNSDTITLVNFLDKYGIPESIGLLSGMFALAIFDRQSNKITIARDMYGEKPLFFSQTDDELNIYSDPRLVRVFNPECSLDDESLSLFILTNNIPFPYCAYKNFSKLDPGSCASFDISAMRYTSSMQPEIRKYSDFSNNYMLTRQEPYTDVVNMLSDVLEDQIVSDRPVAFFLSGGIDSSLLTAIARKELDINVDSFAVSFNDSLYNESYYSTEIASILGTNHTTLHFDQAEIPGLLDTLISRWGEPFGDSSALASLFLCKHVSYTHQVAISGDGADEVFFGYNRYKFLSGNLAKIIRKCPDLIVSGFESIIKSSESGWIDQLPFRLPRQKIEKLIDYSRSLGDTSSLYSMLYSMSPSKYCNNSVLKDYISSISKTIQAEKHKVEFIRLLDLLVYLPNDILQKVDISSMAYGLEVRSPYLDPRMKIYADQFSRKSHVEASSTKKLLRKALAKYIPHSLINRPKMGFGVPIANYLRSSIVKEEILDSINSITPSVFNFMKEDNVVDYYKNLLDSLASHPDSRAIHELWNIAILVRWLKACGHLC